MMKLPPIITHLTDTDLYKFTMNQVMFHSHTNLMGTYIFKCRNKAVKFTKEMIDEIILSPFISKKSADIFSEILKERYNIKNVKHSNIRIK